MTYTLDQYSADCRAALLKDPGPVGGLVLTTLNSACRSAYATEIVAALTAAIASVSSQPAKNAKRAAGRMITEIVVWSIR